MGGSKVILVAVQVQHEAAETLLHSLQTDPASNTRFTCCSGADVSAQALASFDAAILLISASASQAALSSLLDLIEEAGIVAIAMIDDVPLQREFLQYSGALTLPRTSSLEQIRALLGGVLHQQSRIKRLRDEASLSQRFNGGLKGQIAKMHEELQLAAMVQREFLPRELPSVHGVEFAAMWRPTNYVSGDIYDLIHIDEDRIGIFLADAVGHGVPAALMTMVICRSLITQVIEDGVARVLSASEVLARLNGEMIRRQGESTRFVTAVYAVLDCRNRTVQLAGAGHPPPLLLSHNFTTTAIETSGGLLGVFADEHYGQIEFELEADDRLLFYTDGFEQAFPSCADDSLRRRTPTVQYRHEFDRLRECESAADMVEAISRRIDDQAGSLHQVDDLTMICVRAGSIAAAITTPQSTELRLVS